MVKEKQLMHECATNKIFPLPRSSGDSSRKLFKLRKEKNENETNIK